MGIRGNFFGSSMSPRHWRIGTTRHECFPCSASNQQNTTSESRDYPDLRRKWKNNPDRGNSTGSVQANLSRTLSRNIFPGSHLRGIETGGRDHEYLWTKVSVILCSVDCIRSKSHWYTLVSMRKGEPLLWEISERRRLISRGRKKGSPDLCG